MSWSPDLYIGELRPWPDSVHVVRGNTDETRRYTPERKDVQEALERRIDELCAENEQLRKAKDTMRSDAFEIGTMLVKARDENAKLRADQAHWELGNCPNCPNVVSLQEALEQNAKLREFATHMANALGIDSEWCDTSWCDTDCMVEFGCQPVYCGGETRCPAWARLKELGVVS